MARRRQPTATLSVPLPFPPAVDPAPFVRMATDLALRSGQLWLDLWFRSLDRGSAAFWDDVRHRSRRT